MSKVVLCAGAFCLTLVSWPCGAAGGVRLTSEGWFRDAAGDLYVPLGGFHGNMIPLALIDLTDAERRAVGPHIWMDRTSGGQGYVDLWDAPDSLMRRWFARMEADGATAIRLFPRARVGSDVLDLCGKLNPELARVFHRAFRAARPHHIRFLLQIMPEPWLTGYMNADAVKQFVLPRYSSEELARATPAQRRFLSGGKRVEGAAWFTDPDVLECQKRYLDEALAWVAREPQVFALELYNEQGWARLAEAKRNPAGAAAAEDAEIRWSAEIVRYIHRRLPAMPVTISHPGAGLTGFDPLRWSRETGADFYSSHLYAGQCGESAAIDFAAVTGATAAILAAGPVNFPGEWGVLASAAPEDVRRRAHRDAIWLTLTAGAPGFLQWTYDFPDEYRWVRRVFRALGRRFSPRRTGPQIDLAAAWRKYEDSARYPMAGIKFPFTRERRQDGNLQSLFTAYDRALALGIPVRFAWGAGVPPDAFPRDVPASPRPIRAAGGYQLSYLEDSGRRVWLGYLRSRRVEKFGSDFLGVPVAASLRLEFELPPGHYTASIIGLSAGSVRRYRVAERDSVEVSARTSDDYVLLLASDSFRLRL